MTKALGTLPNAPLAFVMAQVRLLLGPNFNRDEVASAMHGDLFDLFPRSQKFTSQKLVLGADGVPRLEDGELLASLASLDQREEVLINSAFLGLQATKYGDYPQFRVKLNRIIDKMFTHFGVLAVQQVGLRYIDFIYPKLNDTMEKFLPAAASKVDVPGKLEETSLQATDIALLDGRVIVKVTRGKGKAMLPTELGPVFNLAPSPIMQRDPGAVDTAILDIDCIYTQNTHELKDADAIMAVFDQLHETSSLIFKKMTTSDAMKYWETEQ